MFVFRNEIIEEKNDDLRYPRKQSLNSAPDYTKKIVAELSNRRNLRKKNVSTNTRQISFQGAPSPVYKQF